MKITIRAKLVASFLTVLIITGLIGYAGIREAGIINDDANQIGTNWMKKADLVGDVNTYYSNHRIWLVAYVFAASRGDQVSADQDQPKIEEADKNFETKISQVESLIRTEKGRQMIGDIKASWEELQTVDNQVISLAKAGKYNDAVQLVQGDSRNKYNTSEEALAEFKAYNDQLADNVVLESRSTYESGRRFNIILLVLGEVIGIALALFISQGITKSVKEVASTASRMADGDLTVDDLNIRSKDEIGEMGQAFNRMLDNFKALISEVNGAIQGVTSTSEELSATSEQNAVTAQQIAQAIEELAKGNTEQTNIVNESVNTVEQLIKTIDSIAGGAQEQAQHVTVTGEQVEKVSKRIQEIAARTEGVKHSSEQNYQAAQQGGAAVDMAIKGMEKIQLAVTESSQKMAELGKQSQQIGEIIQVIDDIAEQTNLLALNAAIEAARAGDHGKGFAVVADEVRKLAERSSKATKEIEVLITTIQTGTKDAIKAMDMGTNEVAAGVETAKGAGNALDGIQTIVEQTKNEVEIIVQAINKIAVSTEDVAKAAEEVAAITQENTAATEEMAAGSHQVNSSIMNIASIAQESAAAAEEVSASAEEMNASTEGIATSAENLTRMAQNLQKIVAQFRL